MEIWTWRCSVGAVTCPADRIVSGDIYDLWGGVPAIFEPFSEVFVSSLEIAACSERTAQIGVHRKFYRGQVHDRTDRVGVVRGRVVVVALEATRTASGGVVDEWLAVVEAVWEFKSMTPATGWIIKTASLIHR